MWASASVGVVMGETRETSKMIVWIDMKECDNNGTIYPVVIKQLLQIVLVQQVSFLTSCITNCLGHYNALSLDTLQNDHVGDFNFANDF